MPKYMFLLYNDPTWFQKLSPEEMQAADYDEAVRLAGEHPHLEYGGTIEVRHVFGT